jgi:undecaprenol kinase
MKKHSRAFIKSLGYALNGIVIAVKYEIHMRIHLLFMIMAVSLGVYFKISSVEWLFLVFTVSLVIFA